MKEIVKTSSDPLNPAGENQNMFKGYTLEELRYQRALIMLKKEFAQSKLLRNIDGFKKTNLLSPAKGSSAFTGRFGSVASKLLSGLNYIDYAMLGFSLFNSGRKVYSFFHKKK